MSVTMTAKQLRAALEFCNPDGPEDADQMDTEVTIWMREEDGVSNEGEPMPRGLYCHLTEYPEEGCIPLDDVPANVKVTGAARHYRAASVLTAGLGYRCLRNSSSARPMSLAI